LNSPSDNENSVVQRGWIAFFGWEPGVDHSAGIALEVAGVEGDGKRAVLLNVSGHLVFVGRCTVVYVTQASVVGDLCSELRGVLLQLPLAPPPEV